MNAPDSKPHHDGVHHDLRERCLALGLPVWRCDGDGAIVDFTHQSEIQATWLRSPRLRILIESATRTLQLQAAPQPVALFAGCWLLALIEKQGLRCVGMTVTIMLEPWSLGTPEFLEICRAARIPPGEARKAVKSMLRADRVTVDQTVATFTWMHHDLQRLHRDLVTLDQFSNKLSQGYEETNMLFRFARMMNAVSNPEHVMEMVCGQLQQVLPLDWVALKFQQSGYEVPVLAGRLFMGGRPSCSLDQFNGLASQLVESGTSDNWTRLLNPAESPLASLVRSEIIVNPIMRDDHVIGVLMAGNKNNHDPEMSSAETQLLDACADFLGVFHENMARFSELRNLVIATVRALAASVDAKDPYTRGHSERVGQLSWQMAIAMGLPPELADRYRIAGILHDVGKIGVPEAVLCKPGRLTVAEFEQMKLHPRIGYDILKDIAPMADILPGVLHHHERWDGQGYPDGVQGENISLLARVLCLADSFDAMSSNRSYRPAMTRAMVMQEIHRCAGTQFDPGLTPTFLKLDFASYDAMVVAHRAGHRQAA